MPKCGLIVALGVAAAMCGSVDAATDTDLERLLSCNDSAAIATAPDSLRPVLQSLPGVSCERKSNTDGEMLECLTAKPVTAFG